MINVHSTLTLVNIYDKTRKNLFLCDTLYFNDFEIWLT